MDTLCNEIGINIQHLCETSVAGRYQLICDKQWLQTLEQRRKIAPFNIWPNLDRRAHPGDPLDHPWTRILMQTYAKKPNLKVFPLQRHLSDAVGIESVSDVCVNNPLTYSQALAYVTNTNFKNLWKAAYKQYPSANAKCANKTTGNGASGRAMNTLTDCNMIPYDVVLKELIQRIYGCPLIHCQLHRVCEGVDGGAGRKSGSGSIIKEFSGPDCHANIMSALITVETSTHFCVLFYPPATVTNLYDCITYSPSILGRSYNKVLFIIYQVIQLSKALQTTDLLLGDLRLHDIMVRENLWIQILPRLESCILGHVQEQSIAVPSPIETAHAADAENSVTLEENENDSFLCNAHHCGTTEDDGDDDTENCTSNTKFDLQFAYDLEQFTLREYCEMWCNGQLSNYDYLTILNNAAGRSLRNPAYHHIMPWVTDFTARNGLNWRDLTRSKYRLNKGDIHLDLMFSHASHQVSNANTNLGAAGVFSQVPHHVSDFLSEITYFVYMARRTPQHVLCQHVRPIWVPAEYPASIQRLQKWTPDECIPEFYSDPMIFKSIHEDLPDLEVPTWASCPEDFISKHREALESQYVSERLQHWIDLNFGYKLSGKAAIKSKNVCLSLVDQHKELCQRGIVQLFTTPHPAKRFPSPWFNKTPPRFQQMYAGPSRSSRSATNTTLRAHGSRRLAKSTENLNLATETSAVLATDLTAAQLTSSLRRTGGTSTSPRMSLRAHNGTTNDMTGSGSSFYSSTNFIDLPKDYNPCALLQSLEAMELFFARTFPEQKPATNTMEKIINSDMLFETHSSENSFTNRLFVESTTSVLEPSAVASKQKPKSLLAPSPCFLKKRSIKQLVTESRVRELQVLGCLIVELFSMQRLRALLMNGVSISFDERLQACRTVAKLYRQDIPKCFRYAVTLLLQQRSDAITDKGLPAPTATQLLEPILVNQLIPFPATFYPTYALIRSLYQFDFNASLLELRTHFDCNGRECARYTDMDRQRVLFERKIAECKVMSCCAYIGRLLEPIAYEQFSPVELLLPHIIDLLLDEQTSILTAWNLFDPVAQALGIVNTQKYLLLPIMKLYDVESFERGMMSVRARNGTDLNGPGGGGQVRFSMSSSFKSRKSVKLYHHSFLLRLIVRFGLKCFLQNFIAPLIEAVGGYKEPEDGNGFHYHSSTNGGIGGSRRTSRNLNYASAEEVVSLALISGVEDADQQRANETTQHLNVTATNSSSKQEVEDVFSFDDDANSDHVSNSGTSENKSIDSFDMRPAPAEEAKEDTISEIFYGSKISASSLEDADKVSLSSQCANESLTAQLGAKSPTIEIPASAIRLSYQLNTIDCDIGSRKSIDSFEIITRAVEEEQKHLNKQQQQQQTHKTQPTEEQCKGTKEEHDETQVALDSLQATVISKMSEAKAAQNNRISEMSAESLIWLAHRLGPSLTSRYITRNLLKMLSLCYVGQENLLPEANEQPKLSNLNYFSMADARVVGDRSAARVLECLMSIAVTEKTSSTSDVVDMVVKSQNNLAEPDVAVANSFGTNVIGNRIEVVNTGAVTSNKARQDVGPMEVLDMVAYKFDQISTSRHLKGNWLAYCRHEISRSDKDTMLNLKHIKLQYFTGHTNSVRSIVVLDNENSFISASKDKTVKLWSLRSEGDGRKTTSCQFTYTAHKKSIHSLAFLETMRYVVSCDSGVHVWDPFIGRPLGVLDAPKHNAITVVRALPSPSPLIMAGTAESSVKIIDTRCMQYVNEWRVSKTATQSNATVRCLTVAPSGNWLAVGLSSGSIVMLDTRMGCILNSWRPMECDLLQLAAPNDQQLISSALDHSLAVWHASDGILHYQLKPPAEPAHFLQTIGSELIYATTGNRIGIYSDISSSHATHSITKLGSETFRGVLTSLAVLPLNRTFLAGNESGNIVLLC
ncbi:WD repeat-containing protein 81 isoform X2 [Eurosta solidaginis]|uniref:WD repeat-containing protein 81 isoform X2 n=1 Tax=Eurosta solidaginis TaxID=178769 RepID=UPI0035317319